MTQGSGAGSTGVQGLLDRVRGSHSPERQWYPLSEQEVLALLTALEAAQSEIEAVVRQRDIYERRDAMSLADNVRLTADLAQARARIQPLRDLLARLWQWDHMAIAEDGPYWRREIDQALDTTRPAGGDTEQQQQ